jgi:hypothetical protein
MESNPIINLIYLLLFSAVFSWLALVAMKRRLIK